MSERRPKFLTAMLDVVRSTVVEGGENDLMLFSAATAYSLLVSLAPLTIALSAVGTRLATIEVLSGSPLSSRAAAQGIAAGGLAELAGPAGGMLAALIVIYGSSLLFVTFIQAMNRIWRQGSVTGVRGFARQHLFALLLLLVAAFGLFLSAVFGTALASVSTLIIEAARRAGIDIAWVGSLLGGRWLIDFVFAGVLYTTAFASVPRIRPRLRDVVPGGLITAAAYATGQWVLAIYLSSSARFTSLGSFGGFLAFVVWAYYTAVIVLWGAELTYQIAKHRALVRGGSDAETYVELSA